MSKTPQRQPKRYTYADTPGALDRENAELAQTLEKIRKRLANPKRIPDLPPPRQRTAPKKGGPSNNVKREAPSGSTSSLSPPSQLESPTTATGAEGATSVPSSPASSNSSLESRQPPPAPAIPQYQTFGPDPSTFDDPTIYHIRKVRDDMTDEEKKEIYCVAQFPKDDLSNLIAGIPPDKDFSNAKPANQVNANTFIAYIEPFLRPLTEEDMAFLKERVCIAFQCTSTLQDSYGLGRSNFPVPYATSR